MYRLIFFLTSLTFLTMHCTPKPQQNETSPSQLKVIKDLRISGLNRERSIRVYLPPNYVQNTKNYPVIYLHDAQNLFDDKTSYAGEWGVDEKLDSIAKTTGLEFIAVGIDHGNEKRLFELSLYDNKKYGKSEGSAYLDFIIKTVKPFIDSKLRTKKDRANTYMFGSSMGGLLTHSALLEAHTTFSKFGIFSPSYWYSEGAVYNDTRKAEFPAQTKAYLLVGKLEGDTMDRDSEIMYEILQKKLPQADVQLYVDPTGKHNEAFWRKHFARVLVWLSAE